MSNVQLIAHTAGIDNDPNPMSVVERAACTCYDSTPNANYRVALACARSGHLSVYEHISFTFEIPHVSRALLAQLTRHRHASFSVRSQRYCAEDEFSPVVPCTFTQVDDTAAVMARCIFNAAMEDSHNAYTTLRGLGIPSEDARAVLPNACATQLVLTTNARALIEMSHLRMCTRAQHEIRDLFFQLRCAVESVCPEVAALMVPKCEQHPDYPFCTEQKSCGRHPRLQDVYHLEG